MTVTMPRERTDGRWDMTVQRGGHVFAAGFCAGHLTYLGVAPVAEGDFHTDGHETADEACACYRRYLASKATFGTFDDVKRKCKTCGRWTQRYAQVGPDVWALCPKHQSPSDVESALSYLVR